MSASEPRWRSITDTGLIATPMSVIDLQRGSLADIARIATEQSVDGIVAGLPLNMLGDEGYQARDVRAQWTTSNSQRCLSSSGMNV